MSQYLDLSSMNAALKELYDGQVVENLVYADNPFLAMIKKNTDFGGKYKPIPIITGASQGRSSTFSNAQGNQSAVQIESFLLTRSSDYSIATIDNQTMLASKTDKMAFLEGAKLVIDGAIRSITNSVASSLFRSGTGSIGQIASISTSGSGPYISTVALGNANDIVQFEVNMYLVACATDGGAASSDVLLVTKVNRSSGVITLSSAASPSVTWAAGAYLVIQGDLNLKPKGLAAWLPKVAPTAGDNFFGVDRSVDPTRLGGVRYDGSAQSIEESIIDASSLLAREGGKPNVLITNFASYAALEKALGSKVTYTELKGPADIAFRGIMINGANSMIKVFPDRNVQALTGYLLQMDTWALEGLGEVPQILRYGDGLEMLRVSNADAGEVRVGAYYAIRTNAPGWNAVVSLSA